MGCKSCFLIANKFSITYYTLLSISPSCKMLLNLSNIALTPAGERSVNTCPHSIIKSVAISTESSVGFSKNKANICKAKISWTTY